MLKKMRWRFIWAAMTAFFSVMLLLAVIINIGNYYVTAVRQDSILQGIYRYEQEMGTEVQEEPQFPVFEYPGIQQPEFEYTTRFFIVRYDSDGNVSKISKDFIASVTEERAEEYAGILLEKGRKSGYFDHYRYRIFQEEEECILIFLSSDAEIQFMKNLLIISVIVVAASLLVIFLLIFILSKRAILPYVRNLERQRQFITDAGHELKTPLTSISTSTDVLVMLHGEDEWTKNIQKQTGM